MAIDFDIDGEGIGDLIESAVDTFDFLLPGQDKSLGCDVAGLAAWKISEASGAGDGPDGQPFRPNEAKYAAYKYRRYGVDHPGELSGQTFSQKNCLGKPEVSPDKIVMTHGLGIPPQSDKSRSGVELRPSEMKATDKQKGVWLTESGREFYGISVEAEGEINKLVQERLGDHLDSVGL